MSGKHRKEVDCTGCNGRGQVKEWRDGKYEWVQCTLCNGKGKQP